MEKRQPLFLTDRQIIVTLISYHKQPNGYVVLKTSDGMRDNDVCIPIESELEYQSYVDQGFHVAPSDKEAIENYFKY